MDDLEKLKEENKKLIVNLKQALIDKNVLRAALSSMETCSAVHLSDLRKIKPKNPSKLKHYKSVYKFLAMIKKGVAK